MAVAQHRTLGVYLFMMTEQGLNGGVERAKAVAYDLPWSMVW